MDSLISRQAAIDLIQRMRPYQLDGEDCMEIIANMPSAQEWILCENEMPEDGNPVLIQRRLEFEGIKWVRDIAWHERGYWWTGCTYADTVDDKDVVAWMPLPEIYKEKEDE